MPYLQSTKGRITLFDLIVTKFAAVYNKGLRFMTSKMHHHVIPATSTLPSVSFWSAVRATKPWFGNSGMDEQCRVTVLNDTGPPDRQTFRCCQAHETFINYPGA